MYDADTMVFIGGGFHEHYVDESCFESDVYAYSLTCGEWSSPTQTINPADAARVRFPRSGAAAIVRDGVIYLIGGYNSRVNGDVLAIQPSQGWCQVEKTASQCGAYSDCGFCTPAEKCLLT